MDGSAANAKALDKTDTTQQLNSLRAAVLFMSARSIRVNQRLTRLPDAKAMPKGLIGHV